MLREFIFAKASFENKNNFKTYTVEANEKKHNFVNFIEITDKKKMEKKMNKKFRQVKNKKKMKRMWFTNKSKKRTLKKYLNKNCSLGSKSSKNTRYFSYVHK